MTLNVNDNSISDLKSTSKPTPVLSVDFESESENNLKVYKERCEETFIELRREYPKYSHIWEIYQSNELFFKEVRIKISFPMRKVSSFIVMKQIVITFKLGESKYSSYKLYLQTLLRSGPSDKLDIKNRIIWSKEGRFITDSDTQVDPDIMGILFKLGDIFSMNTKSILDLPFPFLS
jgi:hypothetical protein